MSQCSWKNPPLDKLEKAACTTYSPILARGSLVTRLDEPLCALLCHLNAENDLCRHETFPCALVVRRVSLHFISFTRPEPDCCVGEAHQICKAGGG